MYLAHAGHQHLEETNSSLSLPIVIAGAVIFIAVAITVLVIFDIRRKRASETVISKK